MITKQQLQETKYLANVVIFNNKDASLFQRELIKIAPEIEADIISSALDNNCSCTQKLKDFVEEKRELVINFIFELIENGTIELDLEYIENLYRPKDFSGKVAKTSIQEWPNFIKTLYSNKNMHFRNMHLVKEGEDIYVFFA